jgi:hypothetical protein
MLGSSKLYGCCLASSVCCCSCNSLAHWVLPWLWACVTVHGAAFTGAGAEGGVLHCVTIAVAAVLEGVVQTCEAQQQHCPT